MDRRKFLESAAAGGLGLVGAPALGGDGLGRTNSEPRESGSPMDRSAQRPNLVFVFADQLRTQSCGYYGGYADDPLPYTPNLDALQQESCDFRNAVAGSPICCAYRASLMTGKYQSSTGMVINELRVMPDPDAVGHVLSDAGYRTGYIGKWHMYGKNHSTEQQFVPPGPYRLGFDDYWAASNFNHKYYEGFYFNDTFDKKEIEGYEPHAQTDMAIDFMRRAQQNEEPFALFLSWGPPHDPWNWGNSPETFNHLFRDREFPDPPNFSADGHARYWVPRWDEEWYRENWMPTRFQKRQGYAAQTSSLDWDLERLLTALDRMGLTDDTIFVFTSDHGEQFGSQGRIAKKIFYEESARVPFLIRYPGVIEPHVNDACLNVVDIVPTLFGLMGLDVPDSMEGMNLSHLARGEDGPEPEAAFLQGLGHTYMWRDGDEWRAVRDKQYTYAKMLADGSEFLFDNLEDPYQTRNLVDDPSHRGTREYLRDWMQTRMADLNDEFRPTSWYQDRWTEDRVILRSATRELEEAYRPEAIGTGG